MRIITAISLFLFLSQNIFSQSRIPIDSSILKNSRYLLADDYQNLYLYQGNSQSLSKYDSVGKRLNKIMVARPIQKINVDNPFRIVLLSINAQELMLVDQHLNEIQTIDFKNNFGYISAAYVEDLQQVWLFEESKKRLLQYNYRDHRIINSYPINISETVIQDLLVHQDLITLATENQLKIYNKNGELLKNIDFFGITKLKREQDELLIFTQNSIYKFQNNTLQQLFFDKNATFVDKNSNSYFVIKDNNLYLYPINSNNESK